MKKVLSAVVAIGLMAATSAAFGATIINSKHNLSGSAAAGTGPALAGTPGTDNSQICIYCHAPHNAQASIPLWNRNNPAGTGFKLYSGTNMQSRQFATGFSSDSTSLFCMSCHDGSTNMNAVFNKGSLVRNAGAGYAGSAGLQLINKTINANGDLNTRFGTDLSKTHPINFPVPVTNTAQNDLWVGTGTAMGGGVGTSLTAFPLFKAAAGRDGGNGRSLECGSCHAVHDAAVSPFLRYTMAGSALCLGCHNK
jgi:predicted CXXCH cytochrome family protein